MIYRISKNKPFQIMAENFAIAPTTNGYTLKWSADGETYDELLSVEAGVNLNVTDRSIGSYYMMDGNDDEDVLVTTGRDCIPVSGGGGGGGSDVQWNQIFTGGTRIATITIDGLTKSVYAPEGGAITPEEKAAIIAEANEYTDGKVTDIENGNIMAGLTKQIYSPDGVRVNGTFIKRTTAGDASISSASADVVGIRANTLYDLPVYDSTSHEFHSGERFTAEYEGTSGVTGEYTYEYNDGIWLPSPDNIRISGEAIDGDKFTLTISETEGEYSFTITYDRVERDYEAVIDDYTFAERAEYQSGGYRFDYDGTEWSENLEEWGITVSGTLIVGDYISVEYTAHDYGHLRNATPTALCATGLNSFDERTMSLKGYAIDSNDDIVEQEGWNVGFVECISGVASGYSYYNADGNFGIVGTCASVDDRHVLRYGEDLNSGYVSPITSYHPVLVFSYRDGDRVCIHPRWSGLMNEVYEPFQLSRIELPELPDFISVGSTRNWFALESGTYVVHCEKTAATPELIRQYREDTGMTIGEDYVFDEDWIYTVKDSYDFIYGEGIEHTLLVNDYGIEYFEGTDVPAVAGITYGTNLVDKLRKDVLTRSNIVHLSQAEYDALNNKDENTFYIIDDAPAFNMADYLTKDEAEDTYITASGLTPLIAGKADAQNVTANINSFMFPLWNAQGVITGMKKYVYEATNKLNGTNKVTYADINAYLSPMVFYAPTTSGTQGNILLSGGSNAAPVWSSIKMAFVTQEQYDELTPDSSTIYFIIG